ncbi:DUF6714 family protein [Stieleria varia]|uniref:Uncharacterized protein n=1 Tax=Stieleria varia TaxID=2528005 RepID=A0A5C6AXT3_9BACT|nr:DUF6714 family protein [Stieleria varia]TWU04550.1 hypothetical protein Pla52n_25920 [Stieleria varia]
MFNIDVEFIQKLKDHGYDLWTISQWENWLQLSPQLPGALQQIRNAFDDVKLGDGVGILEANGLDDYAGDSELARLRKLDERNDWRNLDAELLDRYHATPSFFDARGFVFHLPAFLLAELDDKHEYGFIDRIVEKRPPSGSWIDLLTTQQAAALVSVLSLVKQHPDYYNDTKKFDHAIERFNRIAAANGR